MFCSNCGNKVEDSDIFCTSCGNRVKNSPVEASVGETKPDHMKKKGHVKKSGFPLGIVAGVVVIVFLAIVLGALLLMKKEDNGFKQTKEENVSEKILADKKDWDEYEEDSEGNLTKAIKLDENGDIAEWYEWEYDADGNVYQKIKFLASGKKDCVYKYDEDGNLLAEVKYTYLEDGILDKLEEFDSEGKRTKEIYYQDGENISVWTEWAYDEEGRVIKTSSLAPDGTVGGEVENAYDSEGRKTKEVIRNGTGYIDIWKEWKYDDKGNLLKEERYNNDAVLIEWLEYTYDDKGNRLERIYYNGNGTVAEWYSWEYNENGNCIKENVHHLDGTLNIGYEYDDAGNQIRVIDYSEEVTSNEQEESRETQEDTADSDAVAEAKDPYYQILNEIYDAFVAYDLVYIFECKYFTSRLDYPNSLDDILKNCGYVVMDVNGDGVLELIICSKNYLGKYEDIMAMFTIKGGKAVQVIEGYDWGTFSMWEDGTIYENGYANSGYNISRTYKFDGKELKLLTSFLGRDETGVRMPTNYYRIESGKEIEISQEEYGEFVEDYLFRKKFDFECAAFNTLR